MTVFIIAAALLSAVTVAILAPALRGRRPLARDDSAAQNIRAARRRLRELESDGEVGEAGDAAEVTEARDEIQRALLEDLAGGDGDDGDARAPKTPGKLATVIILAAIPAAGVAWYLWLGAPQSMLPQPPATVESTPSLPEMQARLAQALAAEPNNKTALMLAALAAEAGGDIERASAYLHRLLPLVADEPQARAEVEAMLTRIEKTAPATVGDGDGGDGE